MHIRGVTVESEFGFQQGWECSDNSRIREKSASVFVSSANLAVSPQLKVKGRRNSEGEKVEAMWAVPVESEFGFQQDWECSDNSMEKSASVSASSANLMVSPYFQQQPQLKVKGSRNSEGETVEAMWGVTVESEFGFQQDWECSENSRKREKSDSVSASSANLKVSPYFQQPQLNHGFEITIKPQINNKRKRLPKTKAKAKPIVTADGRRVSPFFQKNDQVEGEGGIAIINSNNKVKTKVKALAPNNKVKMKVKALAPNNKRLVSPYFPHGKNDIVVAIKSKTKAYRHFQPQQDQCPLPLKEKCGDTASMNKRLVSPYFPHKIDDIVVVSKRKPTLKKKKENNPTYLRKSPGTASMNQKRLVSPYFPHEIDDIVVVSKRKPTLKKKKEKNPAYLRKSPDNVWIPPKSVHALLQEKYYEDPWKVLVICMLLNKTSGTQAKNVIQDLFELCPNAEAATMVEINEIRKVIQSLGLQNKRSKKIKVLSEEYLRDDWTHVSDLSGIGKYASDAYAIFCTGNWKEVVPDDHKLVPYWEDLWKSEKMGNCCRDKITDHDSS